MIDHDTHSSPHHSEALPPHGAHHDVTVAAAGNPQHAGHDKHAGHSVAMFRDRFWIALLLTIPTLIWEPMLQEWFNYTAPQFAGSQFIPPLFGILVFLYGGWVFLKGAVAELRDRLPGMMTLISLAISVAFLYSLAVLAGLSGHPLWWNWQRW